MKPKYGRRIQGLLSSILEREILWGRALNEPGLLEPRQSQLTRVGKVENEKSEDEMSSGAFAMKFNPTKWYRVCLKFPCPLSNHQHEMSTCAELFSLNPGDR